MLYEQIASNKRKTWVLLIVFFLLLAIVGYAVGYLFMNSGFGGVTIAMILGFIYALTMIFQSTEIVMSMNGAREVGGMKNLFSIMLLRIWLWWRKFLCHEFM